MTSYKNCQGREILKSSLWWKGKVGAESWRGAVAGQFGCLMQYMGFKVRATPIPSGSRSWEGCDAPPCQRYFKISLCL